MRTKEFSFRSSDGNTRIHAVAWTPEDGEFKAILQIAHGMVEYIERYLPFAQFLTENGFMVVGNDHLGHGESITSQEDWGFFREKNPSDALVEDMNRLRMIVQKRYPDVPYFMFGHSMGSYMLRKYLAKYSEGLAGAIICGTGYIPKVVSKAGLAVIQALRMLHGWRYRSTVVRDMTYSKPYQKFDLTGTDRENSWLTRDTQIIEKYYKDPKCSFVFTLNGYKGLLEAVSYSCRQENVDKIPNSLPIFLVSGEDDPVGDLGEGVRKVFHMFEKSGKWDLECKLYPKFRHEILNEIGREKVYEDILDWMKKRQ